MKRWWISALLASAVAAQSVTYEYDAAGRLTKVNYDAGKAITYTYDANGNLTRRDVTAAAFTVQNSASFSIGVPLAPDSIAYAKASAIAAALLVDNNNPWPTTLGGVRLEITDSQSQTRAAGLYFVDTGQMSFLIPAATALGHATTRLTTSTGAVILGAFDLAAVSPGIFTAHASGSGAPAAYYLRFPGDGTYTQQLMYNAALDPAVIDLGPPTDSVYLSLYGTGFRNAAQATATVGGVNVPVAGKAAVTQYQGEDIVNVGPLPRSLIGRGLVDVVVTFDGKPANTVTANIK